jgi:hypothetical protein
MSGRPDVGWVEGVVWPVEGLDPGDGRGTIRLTDADADRLVREAPGLPIRYEHGDVSVGRVLSARRSPSGDVVFRIAVSSPQLRRRVLLGVARGLSLNWDTYTRSWSRAFKEVSIVDEPGVEGSYINACATRDAPEYLDAAGRAAATGPAMTDAAASSSDASGVADMATSATTVTSTAVATQDAQPMASTPTTTAQPVEKRTAEAAAAPPAASDYDAQAAQIMASPELFAALMRTIGAPEGLRPPEPKRREVEPQQQQPQASSSSSGVDPSFVRDLIGQRDADAMRAQNDSKAQMVALWEQMAAKEAENATLRAREAEREAAAARAREEALERQLEADLPEPLRRVTDIKRAARDPGYRAEEMEKGRLLSASLRESMEATKRAAEAQEQARVAQEATERERKRAEELDRQLKAAQLRAAIATRQSAAITPAQPAVSMAQAPLVSAAASRDDGVAVPDWYDDEAKRAFQHPWMRTHGAKILKAMERADDVQGARIFYQGRVVDRPKMVDARGDLIYSGRLGAW